MGKNKKQNNIITIFKKEMHRFFGDKRLLLAMFLPGLVIYLIYSIMGGFINDKMGPDPDHEYKIVMVNKPAFVEPYLNAMELKYKVIEDEKSADDLKKDINKGELDLYIVFPENFEGLAGSYRPESGTPAPNVEIYYNSTKPNSNMIYSVITGILDGYESQIANRFDINNNIKGDQADEEDFTKMMFSTMMPMLILIMVFSSCMSIVPESVAGEKERGTIATLLVTPLKRSHLAIGKILALSIISLLSGIFSFLGVMLSLPKLVGGGGFVNAGIYVFMDYLWILMIILSSVLFFTSLISIISTGAKSVKEAMSYISPLTALIAIVGMSGMFTEPGAVNTIFYFIPFYNSAQALACIFLRNIQPINIIITIATNIIYSGILVFVLTRMFNSEKVMFRR